jgi:hypothetical protein
MHIQKLLAMISVGAIFGAGSLQAQSADNDIQAKAREALRQKMAALNAQPASTNSPATIVPATPVSPVTPAPAAPSGTAVYPVTPPPSNPQVYAPAPVAPAELPKPATKEFEETGKLPPAAVLETAPAQVSAPATYPPVTASPDLQAKALDALRQKKAELDAQDAVVAPAASKTPPAPTGLAVTPAPAFPATSTPAPSPTASPAVVASQPIYAAPPAMLSGSKEQRLAELLRLYKADQITPSEYHQQRAKIISEP